MKTNPLKKGDRVRLKDMDYTPGNTTVLTLPFFKDRANRQGRLYFEERSTLRPNWKRLWLVALDYV